MKTTRRKSLPDPSLIEMSRVETDEELLEYIRTGKLNFLGRDTVRVVETIVRRMDVLQEQIDHLIDSQPIVE